MEIKSEYYKTFSEYMMENGILPEDAEVIAPSIQSQEEMMFTFIMSLLM